MRILRLALPTPLKRLFDYLPPEGEIDLTKLTPGIRIKVPFQSREMIGILIEVTEKTTVSYHKLRQAIAILDDVPILTEEIYKLCHWASEYYHYALGEVFAAALPLFARKGKNFIAKKIQQTSSNHFPNLPTLNEAQDVAVTEIINAKNNFNVFLLDGVTGSGKTEVYLRVIDEILKDNKQVLVLVPEISLTPQTIERFRERFQVEIAALHSNLTDKARMQSWSDSKNGDARIVIGTRSAVFTPFANLGAIIIDEEHDASFKQHDRFRYHARDVAIMRASNNQIPIILGSATPSLESLLNVKRKRYRLLSLPMRAGSSTMPQYEFVDLRRVQSEAGLSQPLLQAMREQLEENNQVMLFLNRRGFAPVLYCTECAWIQPCKRCDTRMVYHQKPARLHCHHCDAREKVSTLCMQCKNNSLQPVGIGTQRLEESLHLHFPNIPIIRVDRDNTRRKGAMQTLLKQIHFEKKAILIGTQMLAKGHHFPNVTLVGIIDADSGLFSADFRATEQMGQLLLQVSGRAGRAEKPGIVMIQTRQPNHPLLQILIHEGYSNFARSLLLERESALLPPYSYFAVFRAESYAENVANQFLLKIKELCNTSDPVTLLGPMPAFIAKKKGLYCQHLVVKANKRSLLQNILKKMLQHVEKISASNSVKWILDVDPVEVV